MITVGDLKKQFVPNPDDVILIKSLFSHPGWVRYEEKIKEILIVLDSNIEQLTNGANSLTIDNLPLLNQHVNERRMLRLMLLLKDELLEEVGVDTDEALAPKEFTVPDKQ